MSRQQHASHSKFAQKFCCTNVGDVSIVCLQPENAVVCKIFFETWIPPCGKLENPVSGFQKIDDLESGFHFNHDTG